MTITAPGLLALLFTCAACGCAVGYFARPRRPRISIQMLDHGRRVFAADIDGLQEQLDANYARTEAPGMKFNVPRTHIQFRVHDLNRHDELGDE
jgi:hypothetical protein